jgi:hypothetical protein
MWRKFSKDCQQSCSRDISPHMADVLEKAYKSELRRLQFLQVADNAILQSFQLFSSSMYIYTFCLF